MAKKNKKKSSIKQKKAAGKKKSGAKKRVDGGMDWLPWALGGAALVGGILLLSRSSSASGVTNRLPGVGDGVTTPPSRTNPVVTPPSSSSTTLQAAGASRQALRAFAMQSLLKQAGFSQQNPTAARIQYMERNNRYDDETGRAVNAMGGSAGAPSTWGGVNPEFKSSDFYRVDQWLASQGKAPRLTFSGLSSSLAARVHEATPEILW